MLNICTIISIVYSGLFKV